ncbi:MAG TPA: GNAT family N-acetyltransferase [Candidatus Mailhella merdavium]|nr:GNAT family N-acetyltransferase [Candidatus Mailhella merdavium]
MKFRLAESGDSQALLHIYAQYVNTPVTFEYELPSVQEFSERIESISAWYPYLVCEVEGGIAGYAYAHRFRSREAYQWSVELSVYLDQAHVSHGLGGMLYDRLMTLLKMQEVRTAYACVTVPNTRSEALHRAMGFQLLGIWKNAGYKNGKWHDVAWYEKQLRNYDEHPVPLKKFSDIPADGIREILDSDVSF